MSADALYRIVRLANGTHSLHSLEYHETMHPSVGPMAEAEALYVRQLRLVERLRRHEGEFIVWDVGLGAAANALTIVNATRQLPCSIQLLSFDCTLEPLRFALQHQDTLGFFDGCAAQVHQLMDTHHTAFTDGACSIKWDVHVADFPGLLAAIVRSRRGNEADSATFEKVSALLPQQLPAPHVIMFDAYSPARNPSMWTLPLFANLFQLLDPQRPCVLPTYSRSTILRVTLLLAGFYVGIGRATGLKEETTIAANTFELIEEPLGRDWLQRASRSHSAEPLTKEVYRQAPLSPATWERLQQHPQFGGGR